MQSLSVHTAAVPGGFWLHWLTSQARYVRVLIPRRALRASCESPWRVSAKHRISGACFPLTTPFRTCFSPCEVARTADVQKLIGCLYTLRDYSILTCRFHGTGHLSAKHCLLETCFLLTVPLQEHAAHVTRWPITLSSKGSSGTCIPEVLRHSSILLHGATKRGLMPSLGDSVPDFGRVRTGGPFTSW